MANEIPELSFSVQVPADIEQRIAQAILDSQLQGAIDAVLADVCQKVKDPTAWDNPIRRAVANLASEVLESMLKDDPEVKTAIRDAVLESMRSADFAELLAKRVFEKY